MTRIVSISCMQLKRLVLGAVIMVGLGWSYLWCFGLPPYYGLTFIYPGHPNPHLTASIDMCMSDIKQRYPRPSLFVDVEIISDEWPRVVKLPRARLETLGLGALPYVEKKTRSDDPKVRCVAYEMLYYFSTTGTHPSQRTPAESEKEYSQWRRYVAPIWERALYDSSNEIRRMAVRRATWRYLGPRGIGISRRMLRDPDYGVRIAAARQLMWSYHRPDLVPRWLQYQAHSSEVE